MEEETIEQARKTAERTIQKILEEVPEHLIRKEAQLAQIIRKIKGEPLKQLNVLYDSMDEILGFVCKYTPCREGCSYCCEYDELAITEIEIQYIEKNLNISRNLLTIGPPVKGRKCPFLKDRSCSIYPYRPFLCRKHFSTAGTARWCRWDTRNDADFPLMSFSGIEQAYALIITRDGPNPIIRDIREVFR